MTHRDRRPTALTSSAFAPAAAGSRVAACLVLAVVSACGGARPEPPFEATAAPTRAATPIAQPSLGPPDPSASPIPTPTLADNEIPLHENAAITRNGVSWASLSVTEVVVAPAFTEADGRGADRPSRSGTVFIAAHVTVTALAADVTYELEGFRATVDSGDAVTLAFSELSPKPDLLAGTLQSRGDSASGWLLFEAPESGRVWLSYELGSATSEPLAIVIRPL